ERVFVMQAAKDWSGGYSVAVRQSMTCWWRIPIRAADTGETYSCYLIPPNPGRLTGFTHTLRTGRPANVGRSAGFEGMPGGRPSVTPLSVCDTAHDGAPASDTN